MRHADASAGGDDFDRPLSEAGLRQAHDVAARFLSYGIGVDAIVSSSATRAMQTAVCVRDDLTAASAAPVEFHTADDLYNGRPDDWAAMTARLAEGWDDVLMVGHNPAVAEIASRLCDDVVGCPPATVIDARLDDWASLFTARVAAVWRPETPV